MPAAAAGLAYLNARSSLWHDSHLIQSALAALFAMAYRQRRGTLNMFYLLELRAKSKASANRPFVLFGDKSYTYVEVYDRALRYGAWLREKRGVQEKDIVAMDCVNSDTFIFLWMGLWAIGAIPAFLNHNLDGNALAHCVRSSEAKRLVVDRHGANSFTDELRAGLGDVKVDVLTAEVEAEIMAMDPVRYPDEVRYADQTQILAMLIFTSGTTGLPKAASVSWGKVVAISSVAAKVLRTQPDDVFYTVRFGPSIVHGALLMAPSACLCTTRLPRSSAPSMSCTRAPHWRWGSASGPRRSGPTPGSTRQP